VTLPFENKLNTAFASLKHDPEVGGDHPSWPHDWRVMQISLFCQFQHEW
jgi:hypothetical protein